MAETKTTSLVADPVMVSDLEEDTNCREPTAEEASATAVVHISRWRKVVGLIWDSVEGDPEYRKYVQRLDTFFLCVAPRPSLSHFGRS